MVYPARVTCLSVPPIKYTPSQLHAAKRCAPITMGAQNRVNRTI